METTANSVPMPAMFQLMPILASSSKAMKNIATEIKMAFHISLSPVRSGASYVRLLRRWFCAPMGGA